MTHTQPDLPEAPRQAPNVPGLGSAPPFPGTPPLMVSLQAEVQHQQVMKSVSQANR